MKVIPTHKVDSLFRIYAVPPKLDNNLRWKNLKLI